MTEDDHIYWQDTLESVMAGRTNDLKCPFCYVGIIEVIRLPQLRTRLLCRNPQCNHFIEGHFGNEENPRY